MGGCDVSGVAVVGGRSVTNPSFIDASTGELAVAGGGILGAEGVSTDIGVTCLLSFASGPVGVAAPGPIGVLGRAGGGISPSLAGREGGSFVDEGADVAVAPIGTIFAFAFLDLSPMRSRRERAEDELGSVGARVGMALGSWTVLRGASGKKWFNATCGGGGSEPSFEGAALEAVLPNPRGPVGRPFGALDDVEGAFGAVDEEERTALEGARRTSLNNGIRNAVFVGRRY